MVYANWCQHAAHVKVLFMLLGANIYKRLLFQLQPSRFGILAERGKFDNVSYTLLAVAISKKVN